MKRNLLQKINEAGRQKIVKKHTHTIQTVEITVKNGSYAILFLFLNIAWGSDGHLQEIYGKLFLLQSRAPVIKTVSKSIK